MNYQDINEVIVTTRENELYQGKTVHRQTRNELRLLMDQAFTTYRNGVNRNLVVRKNNVDPTPSIMTRIPLVCNIIAGRGYRNVLFVGYYNENETNEWVAPMEQVAKHDQIPIEVRNQSHAAPMELSYQMIPVFQKFYDYGFDMTVLLPPAERNRGVVKYMYDATGVQTTPANKQYKYGSESTVLEEPLGEGELLYDAVVFAGVPKKYADTSFTSNDIKEEWAPYCQPNFEIMDISYQGHDPLRYSDRHNQLDLEPQIQKSFSARAETDRTMLMGRPVHYDGFRRTITAY